MSDRFNSISKNSEDIDLYSTQKLSTKKASKGISKLTMSQKQKELLNVSILESAALIIGVKDDPLSLVRSSAIEKINEFLTDDLGEQSLQKIMDSGDDLNPETTAEQIASLSTSLYGAFKSQHPGEKEPQVLASFIDAVSVGIEKGFSEARDILEGLDVLEGDVARNIEQTLVLLEENLSAFEAMMTDLDEFVDSELSTLE